MALLRVQAGIWLICRECQWFMWPHFDTDEWNYDEGEERAFDDPTLDVMIAHMLKHDLVGVKAMVSWDQFEDVQVLVFTVT